MQSNCWQPGTDIDGGAETGNRYQRLVTNDMADKLLVLISQASIFRDGDCRDLDATV